MGIPRLLFLKQWLTNSTLQSAKTFSKRPTKPQLNLIRTFCSSSPIAKLNSEIINFVANSPAASAVPLLEQYYEEGSSVLKDELPRIVRKLRKQQHFDRALEVSEWTRCKSLNSTDSADLARDLAVHLDLIGKVQGVEAAEKFFIEADEHTERMYGTLLNCYVQAKLVHKSLSHFKKMKEMGIATSSLTYNSIMSLYLKTGKSDKVVDLLVEMEENSVARADATYRMCLKACALNSDFNYVDKILEMMEKQLSVDWFTYSSVANYYLEGSHHKEAIKCLQKAELVVDDSAIGFNNLISVYAKLGDVSQVTRLWQKQKAVCKTQSNTEYSVMLNALVKLDKFEEAERLLEEWESSGNVYDSLVPDVLLTGYAQKDQLEKAERMLEGMISKNTTPAPRSWVIISEGYMNRNKMQKAVQYMEKALQQGPEHPGWVPKRAVISNLLNWLGDHGDIEQVYGFLKLMSHVVPMNKNMYQALLKASSRHGNDIDVVLQRLKADNVDMDEETSKIIGEKIV